MNNVSSLSGGNQQKNKFANENSRLSLCGVSMNHQRRREEAKVEIYELMNHLQSKGVAVIMISSEMTEIIGTAIVSTSCIREE